MLLATGDLGFSGAMTFDLEVWAPGVDKWLEVNTVQALNQIVKDASQDWLAYYFDRGFRIANATSQGTIAQQTDALMAAGIGDYFGGTIR